MEAVKKSGAAGFASETNADARRADEAMLGHRGGGATKQMLCHAAKAVAPDFFTASQERTRRRSSSLRRLAWPAATSISRWRRGT